MKRIVIREEGWAEGRGALAPTRLLSPDPNP